jgi:very-short-patch-repair endonuclease
MTETLSIAEYKKHLKKTKQEQSANKIAEILKSNGIKFEREYKFLPNRKFKFDFVLLPIDMKVAIEFEGVNSAKSRHTSITGYTKDCEKYNLAAINGWKVLRYTILNYNRVAEDVNYLLNLP